MISSAAVIILAIWFYILSSLNSDLDQDKPVVVLNNSKPENWDDGNGARIFVSHNISSILSNEITRFIGRLFHRRTLFTAEQWHQIKTRSLMSFTRHFRSRFFQSRRQRIDVHFQNPLFNPINFFRHFQWNARDGGRTFGFASDGSGRSFRLSFTITFQLRRRRNCRLSGWSHRWVFHFRVVGGIETRRGRGRIDRLGRAGHDRRRVRQSGIWCRKYILFAL